MGRQWGNNGVTVAVAPSTSPTSQIEVGMPKPRPKKNDPMPSLLGDMSGNDSDGDEAKEELL
jgi:hypothetical protein